MNRGCALRNMVPLTFRVGSGSCLCPCTGVWSSRTGRGCGLLSWVNCTHEKARMYNQHYGLEKTRGYTCIKDEAR